MIKVENLSKYYGKKKAISNLSFEVPDGTVTGFLGPNGAGKSTTMRAMLDLDRASAGTVTFTNTDGSTGSFKDFANKPAVAGAMLDATWFHPGRSGLSHLQALAYGAGIGDKRVWECIEMVGLESAIKQRAGGYSLGMKQRLMLAAALLGDPQHLILDEPVNGLDPEGVSWMRHTIREFAAAGKAVLVSSHLLGEMQQTADRLVVIGKGELIGSYTLADFLADGTSVHAETASLAALQQALQQRGISATADPHRPELAITVSGTVNEAELRAQIAAIALENRIAITKLYTQQANLEERFLAATASAQEYKTQAATTGTTHN